VKPVKQSKRDMKVCSPCASCIWDRADPNQEEAFLNDLVERTQASRYSEQDYEPVIWHRRSTQRRSVQEDELDMDDDLQPLTPRPGHTSSMSDPNELVSLGAFFREHPAQLDTSGRIRSASTSEDGDTKKTSSTFGKIAGLVRRKSMGLGNKSQQGTGESYGLVLRVKLTSRRSFGSLIHSGTSRKSEKRHCLNTRQWSPS
jgi:hypothetical protein